MAGASKDPKKEAKRRKKISEAKKGKKGIPRTLETRMKMSASKLGKKRAPFSEEHRKRLSETAEGRIISEDTRKKMSESKKLSGAGKGRIISEETREKISKKRQDQPSPFLGKRHSVETRQKIIEWNVGGFWYGSVSYGDPGYCERWTPELQERIRAAWGYKSGISGKTKVDNNSKALACHHVYYQKKACCVWDEDVQGYYAIINIGTAKNPEFYKHYIKGDPNKFIPLTASEHAKTNRNKLFWIQFFEELIARKRGKCYFTKGEMKIFKSSLKD